MIAFTHLGSLGRTGNMLFQISTAISFAMDNGDSYVFPQWRYEQYFNLHNCFSNNIKPTMVYKEPHYHYTPFPHRDTKNHVVDIEGYWQSYKYFDRHANVIRGLLTPKAAHGIKWGYTGVHVRRGDYLNLTKEYVQLCMDYYRQAMEIVKSDIYIVFSDDVPWCRAQFTMPNVYFSEGRSDVEDLSLLASCENQIIANSSFSWWAAWLNSNPSKIVVAPKRWFGPALPHDTRDLIPSEWVTI